MRITPSLWLLIAMLFVFSPVISDWVTHSESGWYRPYFVWLLVIIVAYWIQRRSQQHDA